MKFYVCETGGTALLLTADDRPMPGLKELVPGRVDGAVEKHVPVRLDGTAPGRVTDPVDCPGNRPGRNRPPAVSRPAAEG